MQSTSEHDRYRSSSSLRPRLCTDVEHDSKNGACFGAIYDCGSRFAWSCSCQGARRFQLEAVRCKDTLVRLQWLRLWLWRGTVLLSSSPYYPVLPNLPSMSTMNFVLCSATNLYKSCAVYLSMRTVEPSSRFLSLPAPSPSWALRMVVMHHGFQWPTLPPYPMQPADGNLITQCIQSYSCSRDYKSQCS